MQKILLLGSGVSVPPLCADVVARGYRLTIASRNLETAQQLRSTFGGHAAVPLNLDGSEASTRRLEELLADCDLVVSYTSGPCLPQIARACLKQRKNLVTSSHVSYFTSAPADREHWDRSAREAGITILTEAGSDPGFGRMLGWQLLEELRAEGGEILDVWYHVGAIPARSEINPLGYRFSWAPKKAIFTALHMGDGAGNWFRDYQEVVVPAARVYLDTELVEIPGVGAFETHPNADSGAHLYRAAHGLEGARTFYHGTLRHFGWSSLLQSLINLGFADTEPRPELRDRTYRELLVGLLGLSAGDVREQVAERLGLAPSNETVLRLQWLGLFEDRPVDVAGPPSYCDIVSELVVRKLGIFSPDTTEADQMIFYYDVLARFGDAERRAQSVTVHRRRPGEFSVCSTLTSLTSAMCARFILAGDLQLPGLRQAIAPEICRLVLPEYARMGIAPRVIRSGLGDSTDPTRH